MHRELSLWLRDPELFIYASLYPIIITMRDIKARSIYHPRDMRGRQLRAPDWYRINCSSRVADYYIPGDRHNTVPRFALLRAFKRGPITICRCSIVVASTRFPPPRYPGSAGWTGRCNSIICTCRTRAPQASFHSRALP